MEKTSNPIGRRRTINDLFDSLNNKPEEVGVYSDIPEYIQKIIIGATKNSSDREYLREVYRGRILLTIGVSDFVKNTRGYQVASISALINDMNNGIRYDNMRRKAP